MNSIKKITSYVLIGLVLIFTIIAILGIWEVVEIEDVLRKSIKTLIAIFVAAIVILFIVAVVMKENEPENN